MKTRLLFVAAAITATFANSAVAKEEMIVEASRRAANIQDVPLAITAIGGRSLLRPL